MTTRCPIRARDAPRARPEQGPAAAKARGTRAKSRARDRDGEHDGGGGGRDGGGLTNAQLTPLGTLPPETVMPKLPKATGRGRRREHNLICRRFNKTNIQLFRTTACK